MKKLNTEKLLSHVLEKVNSGEYGKDKLEDLVASLEAYNEYVKYNQLEFFNPLKYQLEVFETGKTKKNRFLCAANRIGKTQLASYETALHLTGKYPKWWPGYKFNRPIKGWSCGINRTSVMESLMIKLLGTNSVKLGLEELIGTGFIPRKDIDFNSIQRDGAFCLSLKVKHYDQRGKHDGWSELSFKSGDAGEKALRGASIDWIHSDEEHPYNSMRLYTEMESRTMTNRGLTICTFTPENGLTELILHARDNKSPDYWWRQVTQYDVVPELFSQQEVDDRHNKIPKWQHGYKIYGDPSVASGLIYPVDLEELTVTPFEIPDHYKQCVGMDLGFSHPTCAIWSAQDPNTGIMYITDEYGEAEAIPSTHAERIRAHKGGNWIPVVLPKDALQRQKDSGKAMIDVYRSLFLPVLPETFHNGYLSDGKNPDNVEVGIINIFTMMKEGRLKIFSTCSKLLAELRQYRMKEGKILKENDDYCDAMRYSVITCLHSGKSQTQQDAATSSYNDYQWNRI